MESIKGSRCLFLLGDSSHCFRRVLGACGVGRWRQRGLCWGTEAKEKTVHSQRWEPVIIRPDKMLPQSIPLAIRHKALCSNPFQPSSLKRHGVGSRSGSHLYYLNQIKQEKRCRVWQWRCVVHAGARLHSRRRHGFESVRVVCLSVSFQHTQLQAVFFSFFFNRPWIDLLDIMAAQHSEGRRLPHVYCVSTAWNST